MQEVLSLPLGSPILVLMKLTKIKKVLVANRGEIALRVFRTCKEMGLQTVALYTPKEARALHTLSADEAHSLGEGTLQETYLNSDLIIELALKAKAQAIHPGYGFLSENASFAKKVEAAGLIFIGPRPESMQMMGDKMGSKIQMQKLGVPVIPGFHGDVTSEDELAAQAKKIGLPLLIKASAGGGGKGMRIVERFDDFKQALASAKREAKNSFGDDRVLLERYLTAPRHIEVQVMSDTHGNHLHFYERECSIQRRHQKIVEETPSTALSQQTRKEMTECAVKITTSMNYRGAGTIEFIYDSDGSFYFLEMNTRLQVEHPITEMLCGHDLVRLQLLVADGQKIELKQEDIKPKGAAIEVRLCAEDPKQNFIPSVGKIHKVGQSLRPFLRFDCAYRDGDEVTIDFDPMLAKVIAWGETREVATSRLIQGLGEIPFLGPKTNRDYLIQILKTKSFQKGDTLTSFVQTKAQEIAQQEVSVDDNPKKKAALAAAYFWRQAFEHKSQAAMGDERVEGPWSQLSGHLP